MTSASSTSETHTPQHKPARKKWLHVIALPVLPLCLVLGLVAVAWWGLNTERGSATLLDAVPGLSVSEPHGALLGDFHAERVEWASANALQVTLEDVRWQGLSLQARWPTHSPWLQLRIVSLNVRRIDIRGAQPDSSAPDTPAQAPTSLRLPLALDVPSLQIGEIAYSALGTHPLRDVTASVQIGAEGGGMHRIDGLRLTRDTLAVHGAARIGTEAPFALDARVDLQPAMPPVASAGTTPAPSSPAAPTPSKTVRPAAPPSSSIAGPDWRGSVALHGPLERLGLGAALRTVAIDPNLARRPGRSTPTLDLRATLQPYAAWPLAALDAQATAIDLSTLSSAAPVSLIDLQATAMTAGWSMPARITASLVNRDSGRFDLRKLPVRSASIDLRGRPDRAHQLDLQAFELLLGSADAPAGRISGTGGVDGDVLTVKGLLADVLPARLDARASALQLSGPLDLELRQWWAAPGAAATALRDPTFQLKTVLEGPMVGMTTSPGKSRAAAPHTPTTGTRAANVAPPARPATPRGRLTLDIGGTPRSIELRQLRAVLGDAAADITVSAERDPAGPGWQFKAQGELDRFDPRLFWQGTDDSSWRTGPHRLNAALTLDLHVDEAAWRDTALWSRLAALRGDAALQIKDSVLAGVPLLGDARLQSTRTGLEVNAAMDAGVNRLRLTGHAAHDAAHSAEDHWELDLQAPALAVLAPVFAPLVTPSWASEWSGAAEAQARADGRWPGVRIEGNAAVHQARIGPLTAQSITARWRASSAANAPLELQADVDQLTLGTQFKIDRGSLNAKGSLASHRVELRTQGPLPGQNSRADTRAGAGANTDAQTRPAVPPPNAPQGLWAQLSLQGGVTGDPTSPQGLTGWHGLISQAELHSDRPGASGTSTTLVTSTANATSTLWLRTRDVQLALALDPTTHHATSLTLEPGRAEILGAGLRWSRLLWRSDTGGSRIDAQAELEPVAVAPLLQRVQPDFGWGGDLSVVGHITLRSAPNFEADVVLERSHGDLSVTDLSVPQAPAQTLGLTDLRLSLNVHDGIWQFTQALAGSTLGSAAGAQVLRTSPTVLWPAADTPLEGVLQANVATLGTWGAWLPAGWRLTGALNAGATIGGRFGAPEYTGQVRGSGLGVRNLLEGVNVTDGDLAVALQGATARIERLSARGGEGSVRLEGDGTLGAEPRAQLRLVADRFQLLGRVDRRIVASGQAAMQLDAKSIKLDGRFNVDEGLVDFTRSDAPKLGEDVEIVHGGAATMPASETALNGTPSRPPRAVALDLLVNLGQQLRLRGRGLDTLLRGELRLTSPGGRLAVNGSVRAVEGTYAAYGQRLAIERGKVSFNGPVENPRLDILALRPNLDVRVGVAVLGSAVAPRIRLTSEPEMSDIDKLSWLVLGREPDGLGRTDTALLQRAALALLAGEGGGPTDDITRRLGLDEISLRQSEGEVRDTIVSLGKQLSRRWYVGYEHSLTAASGTWQLVYRIAQRFTVRAQTGMDNALDVIWTWRWQ